jgi:hypothetical protein
VSENSRCVQWVGWDAQFGCAWSRVGQMSFAVWPSFHHIEKKLMGKIFRTFDAGWYSSKEFLRMLDFMSELWPGDLVSLMLSG